MAVIYRTATVGLPMPEVAAPVVFITSEMIQAAIAEAGGFFWIAKGEPLEPPSRLKAFG